MFPTIRMLASHLTSTLTIAELKDTQTNIWILKQSITLVEQLSCLTGSQSFIYFAKLSPDSVEA